MPWRLINHSNVPPGSFIFEQTVGIRHKFDATSDITELARQVVEFRKANKLDGADFATALEEVDAYTCLRLGNMPQWCYNSDKPYASTTPTLRPPSGGCCGAHV